MMNVRWTKRVLMQLEEEEDWFRKNKGDDFANTFSRNIAKAATAVIAMPSVGQKNHSANGFIHRSILTHPKCRLYYRYNDSEVVFYKVHFSSMFD